MEKNILQTFLEGRQDYQTLAHTPDGAPTIILTDKTKEVQSLEKLFTAPFRIRENRTFDDLRGFIDYVNEYKTEHTACFAKKSSIVVYFDYHKKDSPQWCEHTAEYVIVRSNRWSIWEKAHNVWKSQRDFSEFLDTGLNEITVPTQSEILALVKNFRATMNYDVVSSETNGGTNFAFTKTTKGGAAKETIEIPDFITITLQPFENLQVINPSLVAEKQIPSYSLRAKINWKMDVLGHDEKEVLSFKIQILNFEHAIHQTLESIRIAMSELTGVKTYIG